MSSKFLEQEISGRPQKSESSRGASRVIRDSCFGTDKLKTILGASSPTDFSQKSYRQEGPSGTMNLEVRNKLSAWPVRSNSEMVLCALNRNAAEFSIPDPQNKYTIGAKDLKFQKRNVYKEIPCSVKVNEQKETKGYKGCISKEV